MARHRRPLPRSRNHAQSVELILRQKRLEVEWHDHPMNALPLIARDLRIRARQKTTYWTRCGVGGLALMAAAAEMMMSANATNPNLVGRSTFRIVSWLGFLLACGCALVTADTLSRERREGTLGL